jgi:hypothetical protein
MPLAEAVRRFVAPGQTIYVGGAHGRPNALVRELVRQWWGKRPDWTLALTGLGSPWTRAGELILTGLVGDGAEASRVAAAREKCGWSLNVAPTLRRFAPPTADELRLVRMFDPRRYFLGESPISGR